MSTEAEALPPKTCSIDRMITVEADVEKVLSGQKTSTRRNGRYADPGEILELRGRRFVVTKVYRQTLGELTDEIIQSEGYPTVEAYKEYITSMHAGMPWMPQMKVWVHEFREL
ncbi:ASCH domain-containing protein [Paenibacillus puerhi]|uniref:ASCH domain-containing protein n=1 Tax=Paenibacillus puerhi TaxID=2692622 RepID=UPI00135B453C|nr:ASCH domain-containing protein [Paenibacillus puerhi]